MLKLAKAERGNGGQDISVGRTGIHRHNMRKCCTATQDDAMLMALLLAQSRDDRRTGGESQSYNKVSAAKTKYDSEAHCHSASVGTAVVDLLAKVTITKDSFGTEKAQWE